MYFTFIQKLEAKPVKPAVVHSDEEPESTVTKKITQTKQVHLMFIPFLAGYI